MAGGAGSNTGTPAASNPLGPQQGQGTPAFGGQEQPSMPSFATPGQQSQTIVSTIDPERLKAYHAKLPRTPEETYRRALEAGHIGNPGNRHLQQPFGNQFGGGFGGGQQPAMLSDMQSDMQYRPERQQPFGGQFGQPMQNPFQPQQPAFMQSPEYQGYQTQMQGLQQQMNDYMQKAPMYQQLQDLQGKMQGYHDNYARQQQQQMMQRPSPFRRGQFQQPMGLMGLMGGRGGMGMASPGSYEQYANTNNQALARASQEVKRPTMSRADFDARNSMSMGMPQARGFESNYRALMKNGGKV